MALEDIVQVTITSDSRGITRKSFGIPLVVGRHDVFGDLARTYNLSTATQDLITDGFTTRDPIFRAVSALARNTPKPKQVVVGRLLTDYDQTLILTIPASTPELSVFAFNVTSPIDGTVTAISYTAAPSDTPTIIAAALDTQIDAITGLSSTSAFDVISVVADNPNEMWLFKGIDKTLVEFLETTVDSNLVAEITAVQVANNAWYGLIMADPQSLARAQIVAAYIETQEKILGLTTHDAEVLDPGSSTDLAFLLNASTLFRTYLIYSGDQGAQAAATWMGNRFAIDPGASTWAYKPLSGVLVDAITANDIVALKAKACNWYQTIAGAGVTQEGKLAGGEFIDVIRGRDFTTQTLREEIFLLLINSPKVPFTQAGIDQVTAVVSRVLRQMIGIGYLSPDPLNDVEGGPPFTITAPAIADVSDADKIARTLPDVNFEAGLAGAIQIIQINGVIKV